MQMSEAHSGGAARIAAPSVLDRARIGRSTLGQRRTATEMTRALNSATVTKSANVGTKTATQLTWHPPSAEPRSARLDDRATPDPSVLRSREMRQARQNRG